MNSYFITPCSIKIKSNSASWLGGEINACFAISKSMDMKDFFMFSNVLNI